MPTKTRSIDLGHVSQFVTTIDARGRKHEQQSFYRPMFGTEEMTGVQHPNWRKKINSGVILNDSAHYTKSVIINQPGTASWSGSTWSASFAGSVETLFGAGQVWTDHERIDTSDIVSSAKLKALASLDSTPSEMFEDLFEVKQTIGFLGNPLQSIANLAKSFKASKDARISRGMSVAKASSETWLQFRFAFLPLVSSATAIANGLFKEYKPAPRQRRAKLAKSQASFDRVYVHGLSEWSQRIHLEATSKATISYTVTNPVGGWRGQFGLRYKDIPKGLWSIVTLSFMIDRIVDIGSAISSIVNLSDPELEIHYACVSTKHERKFSSYLHKYNKYTPFSSNSGGQHRIDFAYSRVPWIPGFTDAIPTVDFSGLIDSTTHITDLITLIIQRLK